MPFFLAVICAALMPLLSFAQPLQPYFFSAAGEERQVDFSALIRVDYSLREIRGLNSAARASFVRTTLRPLTKYVFGPGTNRNIGGPQRGERLEVFWDRAFESNGRVFLPYAYGATWILDKVWAKRASFEFPVPLNYNDLFTNKWKACSDSAPDHQTPGFFWYFWDPQRNGCDHVLNQQYQVVNLRVGTATLNQPETYPEYARLIRTNGQQRRLTMTYAFGYVEDVEQPNPERDGDSGMQEYRSFLKMIRKQYQSLQDTPVYQGEYEDAETPALQIGHRFTGMQDDVQVTITVVAAAGIDQMVLFAKSFAHDHDGVFAWLGHSRVGSGFDAERFRQIVSERPDYYRGTSDYQLIYWGGCNSYSYYTLPFFDFKAEISGGADPTGTRGLDIIANGLPSFFSLNAVNAQVVLRAMMGFRQKTSYQSIVKDLEDNGGRWSVTLVAVLGDEDNQR